MGSHEKERLILEKRICKLVRESKNIYQVCIKLRKRPTNNYYLLVKNVIEKYKLSTTHFTNEVESKKGVKHLTNEEAFSNRGKFYNLSALKKRILKYNIKSYKCECCGISNWVGKPLSLQIHHINGNRFDNRIENLQLLCPNCHSQTDNFCKSDSAHLTEKPEIRNKCKICGQEIAKRSTYCRDCANKMRRKINRPTAEEFLIKFKEVKAFLPLGKFYGVSDNAIRKWCRDYGVPTHTKELIEYIQNKNI